MIVENLCEHLTMIMHTPIRVYQEDMSLKKVYGNGDILDKIFEQDKKLVDNLKQNNNLGYPILSFEDTTLVSASLTSKDKSLYYIIGPVCVDMRKTQSIAREKMNATLLSLEISFCEMDTFYSAILILYESLHDQKMTIFELLKYNFENDQLLYNVERKVSTTSFYYHENAILHNPYDQEEREQSSIREGNEEKLKQSFSESYSGKLATLSKDKLRSTKNIGIVVIAISTRSAIKGGIHPEHAFTLSDSYINEVDEAKNEIDIYNLVREAELRFTRMVAESKKDKFENPLVYKCKNEVLKKMHEKVMIKDIAKTLDVNPNYLSEVFSRSTGMTIRDFIAKEKVKLAENLLIYSEYSIEDIANYLGFSGQSHFGKVFKKERNISPDKYRKKYELIDIK